MTLFILDPNLERATGHHLDWDLSVAKEARQSGEEVVIFANRKFPAASLDGIPVQQWFSRPTYDTVDYDPITGRFETCRILNDILFDELSRLPHGRFTARDAVWVPTLTEKHLLGYVAWIKTFDPLRAPLFVVHLMFPSGIAITAGKPTASVVDPIQATFYGLAFKRAAEPGPEIVFLGGGRQLALEFSALSGLMIEPHPIPLMPAVPSATRAADAPHTVLMYAGDVKADKGFGIVPEMADLLSAAFPEVTFLAHANAEVAWGGVVESYQALCRLAEERPNVVVRTGRLDRDDYEALFGSADSVISTYDPVVYARKSSGVTWEAICLGLPLLVPRNTWMEREAALWGGGWRGYEEHSAASVAAAFADFMASQPELRARSAEASARYRAFNGPANLLRQIGRRWAPRLAAARLLVDPPVRVLPLDKLDSPGLSEVETVNGAKVRWSGGSFTIEFDWPFFEPWELVVDVANAIGAEQVLAARALLDETELTVQAQFQGPGGRIVAAGGGRGETDPRIRVQIVLPWTFRPDGETRDLGVLVQKVLVRPAAADAVADTPPAGRVAVRTPVEWIEPGRTFRMPRLVSGTVMLDPQAGGTLEFAIAGTDPARARALALYVGGAAVPLAVGGLADGGFVAEARLEPNGTAGRNFMADWDLVGQDGDEAMIVGPIRLAPLPERAGAAAKWAAD